MHYFSSLYKKMCAKAVEIQKLWGERIQTWDSYCEKGDYEDDFSRTVNLRGMTEEEIEQLIENNIWLPFEWDIRERVFRTYGSASIRELVENSYSEYLRDYSENEEKLKKIKEHFEGDEISNALALMFVMEKYYKKRWDFDKEELIKGQKEVQVILDRRYTKRRKTQQDIEIERRHADRRQPKHEIVDVVLSV